MNCPQCDAPHIIPSSTEYLPDGDRRRRWCPLCKFTFWTVERLESVDKTQAFQASMFRLITKANGAHDLARECLERRKEQQP